MRLSYWGGALAAAMLPVAVHAQSEPTLIQPTIAPDFDRDRNVSVLERPRPDYDALGIRSGGFLLYPRLELGGGATSNVYLSEANPVDDVFLSATASTRAVSDWSRHQVLASGGVQYRPYLSNPRRNELSGYANLLGRADVGSDWAFTGEVQTAKVYETPFSGQVDSTVAALSSYWRATGIARAQYTVGRLRVGGTLDYNSFEFNDIDFTSGARLDQSDRDRDIARGTVLAEYALSPSLSVYAQASYAGTDYDRRLFDGRPNRDSEAVRVLVGTTLDVAGFLRGTVGIGYVRRDFDASIYKDVGGFSVEGRLEYFPTELTTVTLAGRRVLEDASFGGESVYFDNLVSLRVDHELLRNLLLNASASYGQQDYIGSDRYNNLYQARGGGRYLLSRSLALRFDLVHNRRERRGTALPGDLTETRAEVGIILQR